MGQTGRKKQVQKLVIGTWEIRPDGGVGETVFVRSPRQPEEPITEMTEMLTWAKANYGDKPGTYAFIRDIPGAWICGKQELFSFAKKED